MAGLFCGCPEGDKAGDKKHDDKKADGKTDDKKGDAPAAAEENFWKTVGVGTVAEYKMNAGGTDMTMKYTLKSKDDKGYVLSTETIMANVPPQPATDGQMTPWEVKSDAKPDPNAPKVETKVEDCKVAAGTFKCTYAKVGDNESWVTGKVLIVKTMSGGKPGMELTKLDKK
jgi:hypothetical protein